MFCLVGIGLVGYSQDNKMTDSRYPEYLVRAFKGFLDMGIEVYLIGPRARELALDQTISDHHSFDLTVDAPFSTIETIMFEIFRTGADPVDEERPRIITFKIPKDGDHITFNIGPFRNYLPPLKSLQNHNLRGIILDLATREITIQAFGYDINGTLIDPFGGVSDLENKKIRPILPVNTIFRESGGWLLKMGRYISRYGFEPSPDAFEEASQNAMFVMDVPRDVWRKEMDKLLGDHNPRMGLQFMAESGVLSYILPEIQSLYTFSQQSQEEEHKNVWDHTLKVIEKCPVDLTLRWAALFHDVGKVWTKRKDRDGRIHFLRHEDLSAILFEGIWRRFQIPEQTARKIHFIIKHHSRINLYRKEWTDSAIRRIIREMGPNLNDLVEFSKCDLTSRREKRVQMIRSLLTELQIRIKDIREADEEKSILPKGIGNSIIENFNLSPGPTVGKIRARLADLVEKGTLERNAEHEVYIDYLKQHPELLIDKKQEEDMETK